MKDAKLGIFASSKDQVDNLVHLIRGSECRALHFDQNEKLFVLNDHINSDQNRKLAVLIYILSSYGRLIPAFSRGDFTPLLAP